MSDTKRKDLRGRTLRSGESQRSDGRYQYQYIGHDNKRHTVYSWRLLSSDKSPAGKRDDKALREKEKEIEKDLLLKANIYSGNITCNEMFDIYLKRKRKNGKALSPNTTNNYRQMYDKYARNSFLGKMKISDIRKSNVVDFYLSLQDADLSYGTVKFYHKLLSAVFNMAIDENYIDRNPTIRAMDQIEGQQNIREALTEAQQNSLLEYAKKYNPGMYRKLIFFIDTMCRVSEVAGVTWDNIDMKEKMILIDHQLQYKKFPKDAHAMFHITPTKGREKRYIPMTDRLYQVLKEMKKYYFIMRKDIEVDGVTNFIFYANNGNLLYANAFRNELQKLLSGYQESGNCEIKYLTPHMFRHSGATRNAEHGMDLKVLQYLMGHKSSKITNDIYNHVTKERLQQEALKMAQLQAKQAF